MHTARALHMVPALRFNELAVWALNVAILGGNASNQLE
jgi:hypothetical protein